MLAEPAGFDRSALVHTLRDGWRIEVSELRYLPLGFGTHHYRVRGADGAIWFVNVDELAAKRWLGDDDRQVLAGLTRALGTASALASAGLEFVLAPRPGVRGDCVAELAPGGYAVSVFEFVEGMSHPFGEFPTCEERRLVLAALGRLHAATPAVPRGLPPVDDLAVPGRRELDEALEETGAPWAGGPYAEPARRLLRATADRVRERFAHYDRMVPAVRSTSDRWVVTHGEPHAGNVLWPAGGMRLIDWDTVALGPRERDLWMIEPRDAGDRAAYGGAADVDPTAVRLYRLGWELSEICAFTATLRGPHADDGNTRLAWRELSGYLAGPHP